MIEHRNVPTIFHIQLDKEEVEQLLWLINRALNSLEPIKWPTIAAPLHNHLEHFLHPHSPTIVKSAAPTTNVAENSTGTASGGSTDQGTS